MKCLLTGGSGLLGTELQKYLNCYAPSHTELDITKEIYKGYKCDAVIHCAAYTDVVKAETEREKCFEVNATGTYNLIQAYPDKKIIYISSEYAHNPVNYYGLTKRFAERIVQTHSNHLIIRTSFSPNPFPHEYAFFDQYTQGDYVDVIAPMIAAEILADTKGLIYVGTGRKTMFELAQKTIPKILAIPTNYIKGVVLPQDYR